MKTKKQNLGIIGEDLAAEYLEKKGLQILRRNFRIGHLELDIICQTNNTLVIVEVKSVRVPEFGCGESRISERKKQSIIKATYMLLDRYPHFQGKNVRFDVICVNFDRFPCTLNHHQGAFWQSW